MKTNWRFFLLIPAALFLFGCSDPNAPKYKSPPGEEEETPPPTQGFLAPEASQLPVSFA